MALDVERLLAPISEDAPAGEDLAYDPGRAELEAAFETSVRINDDGSVVSDGPEVDWRRVVKLIEEQFGRSKDVWLAVYLCRAGARSGSLETVTIGAEVLAGLHERFWPVVHPQLEDLGLAGRKAPCDALARRAEFLGPLMTTPLLQHPRLGSYSAVDFERFRASGADAEGYGMFQAALQELGDVGVREALDRVVAIDSALRRADAVFTREAAGEDSPNYAATYEVLGTIQRALQAVLPEPATPEETMEEGEPLSGAPAQARSGAPGRVESREDVIKALDAIADYYRRREPTSPVPLALSRARAWVGYDFMEILQDLAPDGFTEASRILNLRSQ